MSSTGIRRYPEKAPLSLSHGGNTGSNPVRDANKFQYNKTAIEKWCPGCVSPTKCRQHLMVPVRHIDTDPARFARRRPAAPGQHLPPARPPPVLTGCAGGRHIALRHVAGQTQVDCQREGDMTPSIFDSRQAQTSIQPPFTSLATLTPPSPA